MMYCVKKTILKTSDLQKPLTLRILAGLIAEVNIYAITKTALTL